jgi:hypothetical protein
MPCPIIAFNEKRYQRDILFIALARKMLLKASFKIRFTYITALLAEKCYYKRQSQIFKLHLHKSAIKLVLL